MNGIFYGVGLGPGDPDLITVKALKILKAAGKIFAPASKEGRSLAGEIINRHIPETAVEYLDFPMTTDKERLHKAWDEAVSRIGFCLNNQSVAFAALGDPLLYGSYLYLYRGIRERFPMIRVVTVPGIPGMCAAAARSNFHLTAEGDRLLLITGQVGPGQFSEYCRSYETLVIYKPTAGLKELIGCFQRDCPAGTGVIVERCGMPAEKITFLSRDFQPEQVDYFTIVILHPNRD